MEEKAAVRRGKTALCISGSLFLLFTLYYAVMALISPSNKVRQLNEEYAYKPDEKEAIDSRIFSDSAFIALNREMAWHKARITNAESDSISLSLNLSDSSAVLEIKGVAVHIARISWKRVSRVFSLADDYAISTLLSNPFVIESDYSTIAKEPVMLKVAPKDTSEYKPDILPDTSNTAPVHYMLQTENGFRIYVYESNEEGGKESFGRFMFDLHDRFKNSLSVTGSILTFRLPEYHPFIRIALPKADARIIYRGLPRKGSIAVRL